MGKLKDMTIVIDEIIGDIYILGDFHSPESFYQEVFKECKKQNISIGYQDYVVERMKELIEDL